MGSPLITPQLKVPVIDLAPKAPSAADLDSVAAEQAAAIATGPKSFVEGVKGGPTQPSLDSDKFDSLGNAKVDVEPVGPRGDGKPLDVMTEEDKAKVAQATEKRLQAGMSSTAHVDSVGNPKGEFETEAQGHNIHGMRIPDKVDYSRPAEAVPLVGPRGKGAQPDTYHGAKPPAR